MTNPGNLGSQAPYPGGNIEELTRRLQALEQRVASMQTLLVNQGQMVVPSGNAIVALDGLGNTIATVGNHGGTTDLYIHDPVSGDTLPTSQLAFGRVATNDGGASYQQNVLSTWVQGPMSLTVNVVTDKLWVSVSAQITTQPAVAQNCFMSWALAGPTTVAVNLGRALVLASPGSVGLGAGFGFLHTGLTPGTYTITDWYRTLGTLAGGTTGPIYASRSMEATPY